MGAPPKCRLLPSVRAARASSDPVAHRAPQPRPAACAWCEEPPERGLPHCDDRTTWPRSVVPRTGLGQPNPSMALVCAQARLHAQCACRLCQCTRNARAVHAHFTRSVHAPGTRPLTSGVTRRPCTCHTTHPAPPRAPPMPAHAAHAARPAPQEPGRRAARSRDEAPVRRAAGSHLSAAEAQIAAAGAALQVRVTVTVRVRVTVAVRVRVRGEG